MDRLRARARPDRGGLSEVDAEAGAAVARQAQAARGARRSGARGRGRPGVAGSHCRPGTGRLEGRCGGTGALAGRARAATARRSCQAAATATAASTPAAGTAHPGATDSWAAGAHASAISTAAKPTGPAQVRLAGTTASLPMPAARHPSRAGAEDATRPSPCAGRCRRCEFPDGPACQPSAKDSMPGRRPPTTAASTRAAAISTLWPRTSVDSERKSRRRRPIPLARGQL